MILFIIFIIVSGCSEFVLLASAGGMAASQNAYVKVYNGVDFMTYITTEKSIKRHAYEKGKRYIYDKTVGAIPRH